MTTVALIGPDGAGKSTIVAQLPARLPVPTKVLYMGPRFESSNVLLPTSRLEMRWRRRALAKDKPKKRRVRALTLMQGGLHVTNLVMEQWYRQGLAYYYQRNGYLVIFDRHFLFHHSAYYGDDGRGGLPVGTRVLTFLLEHLYPLPDLTICLDAPGEVLLARKGEGTVLELQRLRERYRMFQEKVPKFIIVDTNRAEEQVVEEIVQIVEHFYQT